MNMSELQEKIDHILSDATIFTRIIKDPIEPLKKKISRLITTKSNTSSIKFDKVVGDYAISYCYVNVKTYKPGNKLKPLVSQILPPTHNIAKKLYLRNRDPYIPGTNTLKFETDFLDLLKT